MARNTRGTRGDVRQSALWGSGNRGGEFRTNALWGKGGKGIIVSLALLVVPMLGGGVFKAESAPAPTYVEPGLLERAQANPHEMFHVIVQSRYGADEAAESFEDAEQADDEALKVEEDQAELAEKKANQAESKAKKKADRGSPSRRTRALEGAEGSAQEASEAASRRPRREVRLHRRRRTRDRRPAAHAPRTPARSHDHRGRAGEADAARSTATSGRRRRASCRSSARARSRHRTRRRSRSWTPASRSGTTSAHACDARRPHDLKPNTDEDGRGHGTFVASIAAGSAPGRLGASPTSPIVDVDVMDDSGMARTSDVIAGAEWILEHKNEFNIRVANFSLHSARPSNFTKDPLDQAVEKLWFSGVVVVAAAGNYGLPNGPSGVKFAPGNDPFIITVGALDLDGSLRPVEARRPDLVGLRSHLRRLHEAGPRGSGPVHDRRDPGRIDAGGREEHEPARKQRVHAPLRHVVLVARGRGRGGPDPGASSELDAGSGQGCADGDGTAAHG